VADKYDKRIQMAKRLAEAKKKSKVKSINKKVEKNE